MHQKLKIWDAPLRLFHWLIVLLLVFLWYSATQADDLMQWHMYAGKLMLCLLLFRIIWGFVGSTTARFSHFIKSPVKVFEHLRAIIRGKHEINVGHNPAGGLMVVVMLCALLLQTISGLFNTDDIMYEGPFYPLVSEEVSDTFIFVHQSNFDLLIGLVLLHISAIIFYRIKGDNLITPMFSGVKYYSQDSMIDKLKFVHLGWAICIFIALIGVVFYYLYP